MHLKAGTKDIWRETEKEIEQIGHISEQTSKKNTMYTMEWTQSPLYGNENSETRDLNTYRCVRSAKMMVLSKQILS